ncbi:hypothetical protein BKA70DRAFT_1157460 [Coprinopsis sp. MPI-PUGE-AT-0042]|nr:hypothetical protein BKA70DRAFT_1157460 [Coprinopsis sp. MPI-PUGE-AT-0042]
MSYFAQHYEYLARFMHANAIVEMGVAGMQMFMWLYMASIFLETPREVRKTRLPYLVISFIIMALFTIVAVCEAIQEFPILFEASSIVRQLEEEGWADVEKYYSTPMSKIIPVAGDIAIWIADGLLVYRCYVIWAGHLWVTAVPAIIYLASLGINIYTHIPPYNSVFRSIPLDVANVFLSVGVNVIVTSLISGRLLHAQRQLRKSIPSASKDGKIFYVGIVATLVESAAPVAIFGIGSAISLLFIVQNVDGKEVNNIFSIGYNALVTLLPQLIIFRVATGRSWANKAESTAALSQELRFAEPAQSTHSDDDLSSDARSPGNVEKEKESMDNIGVV